MIHVTVSYPNSDGATFDHDYYREKHLPLVKARLGDALRSAQIDRGLAGAEPGSSPAWVASGHMYFESIDAFQASFGPHAAEILGDVPNFTNIEPSLVISEATDA